MRLPTEGVAARATDLKMKGNPAKPIATATDHLIKVLRFIFFMTVVSIESTAVSLFCAKIPAFIIATDSGTSETDNGWPQNH